jgi:hypothetical protein
MGRWIAIGKVPRWNDLQSFTAELKPTAGWRVTPRMAITEVVVLADGRMVAECHADSEEDFRVWLDRRGWEIESLTPIRHLARTGEVWDVSR